MTRKQKAKAVPIKDIYPWPKQLKPFGSKLRGPCPIHEDKQEPNFFIYTATNSCYCFRGCGGGDSIWLLMKMKGYDFKEAIDELVDRR